MGRIRDGMIVLGLIGVYFGGKELLLLTKVSATPQSMTCADLTAKGPGNNAHIILKEFVPCPSYFICESKKDHDEKGPYSKIFMPALEAGGPWHKQVLEAMRTEGKNAQVPTPTNFRVILQLSTVHDEADLERRVGADTLEGVVINSIEPLGSEEKSLLRKGYPQVDIDNCYVFAVNRTLYNGSQASGIFAGGIVSAAIGVLWILKARRDQPT